MVAFFSYSICCATVFRGASLDPYAKSNDVCMDELVWNEVALDFEQRCDRLVHHRTEDRHSSLNCTPYVDSETFLDAHFLQINGGKQDNGACKSEHILIA